MQTFIIQRLVNLRFNFIVLQLKFLGQDTWFVKPMLIFHIFRTTNKYKRKSINVSILSRQLLY